MLLRMWSIGNRNILMYTRTSIIDVFTENLRFIKEQDAVPIFIHFKISPGKLIDNIIKKIIHNVCTCKL